MNAACGRSGAHRADHDPVAASSPFSTLFCRVLLCSLACVATTRLVAAPAGRPVAPPIGEAETFCLATEFLPYPEEENDLPYRLTREICRQAVLLTARHEFGLATRDETLNERFASDGEEKATVVDARIRTYATNDGRLQLTRRSDDGRGDAAWDWQFKFTADSDGINTSLATAMEAASRDQFVTALEQLGYVGTPLATNPENKPGSEVEDLLGEMSFVSQFAAVRTAHRAIAADGESKEWLGALARGYANLAVLTSHYWNSMPEVFAARSLLYAERMVAKSDGADNALWHQAYARALVGVHREALEGIADLDTPKEDRTGWMNLIEPLCRFEYDNVLAVSNDHPEIRQLAHRLWFQLITANMYDRWIFEKGMQTLQVCPEAYGVYDAMTDGPLGVKRYGAGLAPRAFAQFVPTRLLAWDDVPQPIRDQMRNEFAADQAPEMFSQLPIQFARQLRKHAATTSARSDEPGWGMLAAMIEEEQFVEVANVLRVSQDAVEYSLADMVEHVTPLVEGHRYAPFIASYAVDARRQPEEFAKLFKEMKVVDPRGNMRPLMYAIWYLPHGEVDGWGRSLWGPMCYDRDFTSQGMLESVRRAWVGSLRDQQISTREMFARECGKVSPHSPLSQLLKLEATDQPTAEDLSSREEVAADSPSVWWNIAWRYYNLKQFDDAIRCYKRSLDISRSYAATTGLAQVYHETGKDDLWRETLDAFLEVDDLGLQHSAVHQLIGQADIDAGNWEAAEPHAIEAAQVWSASGLSMAAIVTEGLAKWEDSERWIRAVTESYPSSSGVDWYFWCQRTGRGELEEAKRYAEMYFAQSGLDKYDNQRDSKAVYLLLEGRRDEATQILRDVATNSNRVYEAALVANVAAEAGNAELLKEFADLVDSRAKAYRRSKPAYYDVATQYAWLVRKEKVIENDYARINRGIKKLDPPNRCLYDYLVGMLAKRQGDEEVAEEHLKRAVTAGPLHAHSATLAGHELAAVHGTSR